MAIKFDLSSIDNSATVNSAKLKMYKIGNYSSYSSSSAYSAYRITSDWSESTANWSADWTSIGGDFSNTKIDTYNYNGSYNGWVEFDVSTEVQDMLTNPASDFGFMIADLGGDDVGGASLDQESYFCSSEHSTEAYRPILSIDYDAVSTLKTNLKVNTNDIKITSINSNMLTINSTDNHEVSISIFNLNGRNIAKINQIKLTNSVNHINLINSLPIGMYMVAIDSNIGRVMQKVMCK